MCLCVCPSHFFARSLRRKWSVTFVRGASKLEDTVSGETVSSNYNLEHGFWHSELRELSENSFFGSHLDIGPFCA